MNNVLYCQCVCPHCVGNYAYYSPFAVKCQTCGGKLVSVNLPFDPEDKANAQKFKDFMDCLWANTKKD